MTPASAETVHRPHNTTTPSTSSAFTRNWPDTSIQPLLGIQCHTSIFCGFQSDIWNVWGRHQGCSCEWLITTSQCGYCLCRHVESPYFLELGSSNCQIETTAKRAGIRDAFVDNTTNKQEELVWVSGFHTYWFIVLPVLWYLFSCVMQIKWHRLLPKQFIGQTPLHHIHKFSFHWNLVIQKKPDTVRNPISYKSLPQFPVWYLECMGQASGMQLWIHDHNKWRRTVSIS